MGFFHHLLIRALSFLHRLAGRACYYIGRHRRARRHFEQVLGLIGDDFTAHIYLGRIAYARGDLEAWHRRFELAQRALPPCPRRAAPDAANSHDAGIVNAPGAGCSELLADQPGRERLEGRGAGSRLCHVDGWELELPACDDFASEDERQKFQKLGPIDSTAIYAVDLDELARQLAS